MQTVNRILMHMAGKKLNTQPIRVITTNKISNWDKFEIHE